MGAFWLLLAVSIFPVCAQAQDTDSPNPAALVGNSVPDQTPDGPDKSAYTLFDPVPDDEERQFSTDRPGKTHSSTTVDAGHFQVESDIVNLTYDYNSPDGSTTRITSIATPIFKAGITNNADLELGFDFYNDTHVTSRSAGASASSYADGAGFGDMTLGSKINLFGNEGGMDALAILPSIKIPTAAGNVGNGVVEYALDIPYTYALDDVWSLTAESDVALLKNTNNTGHHGDYSFIVNINRPVISRDVTASLELASEYAAADYTPRYTLDPAVQWVVFADFQLDMGVYIGLNKAATNYNPYVGVSYRY